MKLGISSLAAASAAAMLLALFSTPVPTARAMEVAGSPEEVNLASWRLQQITRDLEKLVSQSKIPGAAFVVTRAGKYVFHGEAGYSDIETLTGFRTNTICRLLSMSKPVSAVAIVKLVEQGKLSLNDTVAQYLPEWKNMEVFVEKLPNGALRTEPANRLITILDLLTHTSGLSYGYGFGDMTAVDQLYPNNWRVPMMTLDEFSQTISKVPLLTQPGTKWRYSYGYDLLGVLLFKVTGQSPDVWMKQNLFDPLKMWDTGFNVPMDKINRYSTSYSVTPLGRLQFVFRPRVDFVSYSPPTFKSLGGGVVSTAKDFARFSQMLLNGGELDGVRILSQRSVDLMWRNYIPKSMSPLMLNGWKSDDHTGQGLGFTLGIDHDIFTIEDWEAYSGDNRIGAVGWGGGAQTNFNINADQDTVITYMTQKIGGGEDYFQSVVVKGVMDSITGPSPRKMNGGFHIYSGWPTPQEEQFGHNAPISLMERYWGQ